MSYGEDLLVERRRNDLKQWEVAKAVGLQTNTLIDIEKCRIQITEEEFTRISEAIKEIKKES